MDKEEKSKGLEQCDKCDYFIFVDEVYPLCKGIGEEKCHNCCVYENYEEYHPPYPEQ